MNTSTVIMRVKFTFKDEIRRFNMTPDNSTFEQVISTIRSLIHRDDNMPLVYRYLDDENEWITIEHDIEFQTAILVSKDILRLDVSELEAPKIPEFKGRRGRMNGKRNGCPRKWKKEMEGKEEGLTGSNESDEHEPVWAKFRRGGKRCGNGRRGHWKGRKGCQKESDDVDDTTESSSIDFSLSLDELKNLKQNVVKQKNDVAEKLKQSAQNLRAKRQEVISCRRNQESLDELDVLRAEMTVLKSETCELRRALLPLKRELVKINQAIRKKKTVESSSE